MLTFAFHGANPKVTVPLYVKNGDATGEFLVSSRASAFPPRNG
ncbi:hypothetical protein [Streptomyces humicola]|nr:hypothetical protein [Streptomyces humicola]